MASTRLDRTPSSASNPTKFTISFWFKRTKLGADQQLFGQQESSYFRVYLNSSNELRVYSGTGSMHLKPTGLFVDPNAWYHFYLSIDTTQGTASDRAELRINGKEPVLTTSDYPSQNSNLPIFNTSKHCIGGGSSGSDYFDGYISHFHIVDGSNIAYTQFGSVDSTTGNWKINTSPTVASFGTNGFTILKDGSTITDQSPNSNNWTVGTGTLTAAKDCPSDNFATLNPLIKMPNLAFSNANLRFADTQGTPWTSGFSSLGISSGKFYIEAQQTAGSYGVLGIVNAATIYMNGAASNNGIGTSVIGTPCAVYYGNDGHKKVNGTETSFGASYGSGDYIGIAVDCTNNKIYFSKNGSWQASGDPSAGSNGVSIDANTTYLVGCSGYGGTDISWNFGNGVFTTTALTGTTYSPTVGNTSAVFKYPVPTNYKALTTKGLNA